MAEGMCENFCQLFADTGALKAPALIELHAASPTASSPAGKEGRPRAERRRPETAVLGWKTTRRQLEDNYKTTRRQLEDN